MGCDESPSRGRAVQGPPHLRPCPQTSEPGPCRWAPLHLNCPPGPQTAASQGPRAGTGGRENGQGPREARATRTEGVHSRTGARWPVGRTGGVRAGEVREPTKQGVAERAGGTRGGLGPRGICGGQGHVEVRPWPCRPLPSPGNTLLPSSDLSSGRLCPPRGLRGSRSRSPTHTTGPARPGTLHGYLSRLPGSTRLTAVAWVWPGPENKGSSF